MGRYPLLVGMERAGTLRPCRRPAAGDAGKQELAKLEGAWTLVKAQGAAPKFPQRPVQFVFKGDRITILEDGKQVGSFTVKVDAGKKPAAIDLIGPAKPGGKEVKTRWGSTRSPATR